MLLTLTCIHTALCTPMATICPSKSACEYVRTWVCAHECACAFPVVSFWLEEISNTVRTTRGKQFHPGKPLLEETYVLASRILLEGSIFPESNPTTHKHTVINKPFPLRSQSRPDRDWPRAPRRTEEREVDMQTDDAHNSAARTKTRDYRDRILILISRDYARS